MNNDDNYILSTCDSYLTYIPNSMWITKEYQMNYFSRVMFDSHLNNMILIWKTDLNLIMF